MTKNFLRSACLAFLLGPSYGAFAFEDLKIEAAYKGTAAEGVKMQEFYANEIEDRSTITQRTTKSFLVNLTGLVSYGGDIKSLIFNSPSGKMEVSIEKEVGAEGRDPAVVFTKTVNGQSEVALRYNYKVNTDSPREVGGVVIISVDDKDLSIQLKQWDKKRKYGI